MMKTHRENVKLKKLVDNLHMNTPIHRENTKQPDMKIKELKGKAEELEIKIGNRSQIEAKNLQWKVDEVIKARGTIKHIESQCIKGKRDSK